MPAPTSKKPLAVPTSVLQLSLKEEYARQDRLEEFYYYTAKDPANRVELTVASFSKPVREYTKRQSAALRELNDRFHPSMFFIDDLINSTPEAGIPKEQIQKLISLLGDIFFFGGDMKHVTFFWDPTLYAESYRFAEAGFHRTTGGYKIVMDSSICGKFTDPRASIIGLLLHEMVHVFLSRYADGAPMQHMKWLHGKVASDIRGATGHCSAFVELASHIEAVSNSRISYRQGPISLYIDCAMENEFKESGYIPTEASLKRCHSEARDEIAESRRIMLGRVDLHTRENCNRQVVGMSDPLSHVAVRNCLTAATKQDIALLDVQRHQDMSSRTAARSIISAAGCSIFEKLSYNISTLHIELDSTNPTMSSSGTYKIWPKAINYEPEPLLCSHHPQIVTKDAIVTFAEKDGQDWSREQRKAMHDFHTNAFQAMNLPLLIQTPPKVRHSFMLPSMGTMQGLIHTFSQVFFGGKLRGVRFEWNASRCSRREAIGIAYHDASSGENVIAMHPDYYLAEENPGPAILGCLLYECCHTFYDIDCPLDNYVCSNSCWDAQISHLGSSGHGSAWVRLATHVEAVAKRYIDQNIHLNIERSMFVELCESGQIPSSSEEWVMKCHLESRHMLRRFLTLSQLRLSDLRLYISELEWFKQQFERLKQK